MGWLFMSAGGMLPHKTPKEYLDAQCTYAPDPERGRKTGLEVLKSTVRSNVYYAACRIHGPETDHRVTAIVCLIKWQPAARDDMIFGYKDMDERMGPYNWDCPASILDLLTPTDHQHALEWRAKCRQNLALTTRRKPSEGDTIILPEPINFSDGIAEKAFIVERQGPKIVLRRKTDRQRVRIPRLMNHAWSLIPKVNLSVLQSSLRSPN